MKDMQHIADQVCEFIRGVSTDSFPLAYNGVIGDDGFKIIVGKVDKCLYCLDLELGGIYEETSNENEQEEEQEALSEDCSVCSST